MATPGNTVWICLDEPEGKGLRLLKTPLENENKGGALAHKDVHKSD